MSIYEGSITLRVRFAADNGYEADNALSAIATEIQDEWNEDLPRDDITGEIDEEQAFGAACTIVVDWSVGKASS
jgi:hypothetical protein